MNFPEELRYTSDHEWVRVEGQTATIGITDFAQNELGDIVFVDIPTAGQKVEQGKIFGSVEAVKTVSDLFMPVSGVIEQVNDALNNSPDLVNSDPYNQGWMIKIKLENPAQLESLLTATSYSSSVGN